MRMDIGDEWLYFMVIKNSYIISVRNIEGWNRTENPVKEEAKEEEKDNS